MDLSIFFNSSLSRPKTSLEHSIIFFNVYPIFYINRNTMNPALRKLALDKCKTTGASRLRLKNSIRIVYVFIQWNYVSTSRRSLKLLNLSCTHGDIFKLYVYCNNRIFKIYSIRYINEQAIGCGVLCLFDFRNFGTDNYKINFTSPGVLKSKKDVISF